MSKPFVTARLGGRLANQFFIHAAAQALAIKHGVEYLATPKPSTHYEENYFESCFPQLSNQKVESEYNEVREQYYTEIPYKPNMRICGYFQSRFYWWDYKDSVLPLFKIKPVVKMDTVSLHFRRGDFLTLGAKHIVMSVDYIKRAVAIFNEKGYSKFMVFSDGIEDCKKILEAPEFKDSTFTFSEGRTPIQDMEEMSGCAHQICSASSYSYMACYMNPNPNNTPVLPTELWGASHRHLQSEESYPPNSIRIPN